MIVIWGDQPSGPGAARNGGDGRPAASGGTAGDEGWDFFVSYDAADLAWAEWIAWQLETDGYKVLIQAWDSVPGSHWTIQMYEGIRSARHTLAVLSRAYLDSVYSNAEWQAAFRSDPKGSARRLIPIRVDEGCRSSAPLDGIRSFDLFGLSEGDARRELLGKVEAARAGRARPATAPDFPGVSSSIQAPGESIPRDSPEFPGSVVSTPRGVPAPSAPVEKNDLDSVEPGVRFGGGVGSEAGEAGAGIREKQPGRPGRPPRTRHLARFLDRLPGPASRFDKVLCYILGIIGVLLLVTPT